MQLWPIGFVLLAAAFLPIQAACNTAMNRALGQPMLVSLLSISGSLVMVLAFGLLTGRIGAVPAAARFAAAPWWAWAAGLGGAFYVSSQPILLPRLGAALFTTLVIAGQVATAIALDHFGALGVPQHPASPLRLLGGALIVVGMVLVARF
jgi:transporter family-2 protein